MLRNEENERVGKEKRSLNPKKELEKREKLKLH